MSFKEKLRPNVLILSGMAFVLTCGLLSAMVVGFMHAWPIEGMMALAITFGASLGGLLSLSAQVATDPEPNRVADVADALIAKLPDFSKDGDFMVSRDD